jgi:AraC-like DNA-binding protein
VAALCADSDRSARKSAFPFHRMFGSKGKNVYSCMMLDFSNDALRPQWTFEFVAACHRLVGQSISPSPMSQLSILNDYVRELPDPRSVVEEEFARGQLLSAAVHWSNRLHNVIHPGVSAARCRFNPSPLLEILLRRDGPSAKAAFSGWAERFVAAFEAEHHLTQAYRAADVIDRRFSEPLDVRELAAEVGTRPRTLDRAFRDAFGVSMHEYWTRARVVRAIPALREDGSNVDAVARRVGYRSTKNFYGAVRRLTGLTPAQIRTITAEQAQQLIGAWRASEWARTTNQGRGTDQERRTKHQGRTQF